MASGVACAGPGLYNLLPRQHQKDISNILIHAAFGPTKLNLERYVEALSEPSSSLTYPALTGSRKQSVIDAERLFNPDLAVFMQQKGYDYEAATFRLFGTGGEPVMNVALVNYSAPSSIISF